jgi:co-chaperonin GroES (HSP10)
LKNGREYNGIEPAGYRILIKPEILEEEITPGGIVLTNKDQEMLQRAQPTGVVVAMGKEAYRDKPSPWCVLGDRVLFNRYVGLECTDEQGNELRLINDTEVLSVISPDIKHGTLVWREPL